MNASMIQGDENQQLLDKSKQNDWTNKIKKYQPQKYRGLIEWEYHKYQERLSDYKKADQLYSEIVCKASENEDIAIKIQNFLNLGVLDNEIRIVEGLKKSHPILLFIIGLVLLPFTIIYVLKKRGFDLVLVYKITDFDDILFKYKDYQNKLTIKTEKVLPAIQSKEDFYFDHDGVICNKLLGREPINEEKLLKLTAQRHKMNKIEAFLKNPSQKSFQELKQKNKSYKPFQEPLQKFMGFYYLLLIFFPFWYQVVHIGLAFYLNYGKTIRYNDIYSELDISFLVFNTVSFILEFIMNHAIMKQFGSQKLILYTYTVQLLDFGFSYANKFNYYNQYLYCSILIYSGSEKHIIIGYIYIGILALNSGSKLFRYLTKNYKKTFKNNSTNHLDFIQIACELLELTGIEKTVSLLTASYHKSLDWWFIPNNFRNVYFPHRLLSKILNMFLWHIPVIILQIIVFYDLDIPFLRVFIYNKFPFIYFTFFLFKQFFMNTLAHFIFDIVVFQGCEMNFFTSYLLLDCSSFSKKENHYYIEVAYNNQIGEFFEEDIMQPINAYMKINQTQNEKIDQIELIKYIFQQNNKLKND